MNPDNVSERFSAFMIQFADLPLNEYDDVLETLAAEVAMMQACRREERRAAEEAEGDDA